MEEGCECNTIVYTPDRTVGDYVRVSGGRSVRSPRGNVATGKKGGYRSHMVAGRPTSTGKSLPPDIEIPRGPAIIEWFSNDDGEVGRGFAIDFERIDYAPYEIALA